MNCPPALITFALKLPHRPRSAVTTIRSGRPCGRPQKRMRIGIDTCRKAIEHLLHALREWPRGNDPVLRAFQREAAIIFIAFVICCVDLTARIRRRKSRSDGISFCSNYATAAA